MGSLQYGSYPSDASNYTDMGGNRSGGHKAPFVTGADFYIEITDRLEKCGEDGLILEAIEAWGKSPEAMGKYLHKPLWSVLKRRRLAHGYVASGPARRWLKTPKRKAESYQEYKRRKK